MAESQLDLHFTVVVHFVRNDIMTSAAYVVHYLSHQEGFFFLFYPALARCFIVLFPTC